MSSGSAVSKQPRKPGALEVMIFGCAISDVPKLIPGVVVSALLVVVSILATDVDPDITNAPLAAKSRGYAIGAARIFKNPTASFTDTNSYVVNAELIKLLSPPMQAKIANYGEPLSQPVSITRSGTDVVIHFTGKLESAETILGPWAEVRGAVNPWSVAPTNSAQFYRATQ